MKFAVMRLAAAAALFVGWIGYLGFLAATTRNPIVLSRPQVLVSQRDVIATYKGGNEFTIDEVLYPNDAEPEKGKTLVVNNWDKCETFTQQNGWRTAQASEGAQYLLPLQTTADAKADHGEDRDVMDVVATPTTAALAGPPRIYPDSPEVRRQYQALAKP
ncbi:MAG TPA: hypothetical protein VMS17_03020 [Gemmataceae bacterium]|nr:hypothetical protein [Gemmataceae bacterium]